MTVPPRLRPYASSWRQGTDEGKGSAQISKCYLRTSPFVLYIVNYSLNKVEVEVEVACVKQETQFVSNQLYATLKINSGSNPLLKNLFP